MSGIDLSNHFFAKSGSSLNEILKPALSPLKLNFFRYLKLYKDGSRINLCNNSGWTNHFYNNGLYNIAWYDKYAPSFHHTGRSIWDEKCLTSDNIVGINFRTIFKLYHGFSVIRSNTEYCEFFDFATAQDNIEINEVYLRSPETIDEIIFYFKSHARSLIIESEKNRIILPMETKVCDENIKADALSFNSISKFYIDTRCGETYLTRREYDCLSLWFCGKTAKQIAQILGLSFRTIETHLENIKGKFGIQYKDKLFAYLQSLGLFEAFVKNGLRVYQENNT